MNRACLGERTIQTFTSHSMRTAKAPMAGVTLAATDSLRQMNFPRGHEERLTSYFVTFSVTLWSWLCTYGKRMPLGVENIRLFKNGYKCCSILRTFWTVFKPWDGLARTMTAESTKGTQGQWTVTVLWLFQELQEVHLSVFLYDILAHKLQRAESTGLVRWALGSGTRLTLCWLPWQTAAPSVCTRAAVEEASVTATANNLGRSVSWPSTQSGGEGGR